MGQHECGLVSGRALRSAALPRARSAKDARPRSWACRSYCLACTLRLPFEPACEKGRAPDPAGVERRPVGGDRHAHSASMDQCLFACGGCFDPGRPTGSRAGRRGPRLLPPGQDQLAPGRGPVPHDRPQQAPLHRITPAPHPAVPGPDRHQRRVPHPPRGRVLHQARCRPLPAARRIFRHHDGPDPQLGLRHP